MLSNLFLNSSIPCLRRRAMKLSSNKWLQKVVYLRCGCKEIDPFLAVFVTDFFKSLALRNDCQYCFCIKLIFFSYVLSIGYFMLRARHKIIQNASNTPHKCTDCGFIIIYLYLIKQERKQENKANKVCVKQQTINLHICDSTELDIQTTFTIIWMDRCLSYIK